MGNIPATDIFDTKPKPVIYIAAQGKQAPEGVPPQVNADDRKKLEEAIGKVKPGEDSKDVTLHDGTVVKVTNPLESQIGLWNHTRDIINDQTHKLADESDWLKGLKTAGIVLAVVAGGVLLVVVGGQVISIVKLAKGQ